MGKFNDSALWRIQKITRFKSVFVSTESYRYERTKRIVNHLNKSLGFPSGTSGKESTCQCKRHERPGFDPWVRKIPGKRKWQPTPVFLPGESHGHRSLVGYSP